jgi:hypothetical protein
MAAATITCPRCRATLEVEPGTGEIHAACPQCAEPIEAYFFPAFFRPIESGAVASAIVDTSEASCFYHPLKQAAGVCDGCGRMICALCSVDLGNEHLCPTCIASGKKKGKLTTLEDRRTRYDNVAMALAVGSFFFPYLFFLIPPAAIFVAIRNWRRPGSLLGVSHVRFVIAILIALASFAFGLFSFGSLFLAPFKAHHG